MKVLILSHNCFNTSNNMGKTFESLFSKFDKNELCQFYIHNTLPNIDKCNSYYRITDKDAFKGIFSLNTKGSIILKEKINENNLVKDMYKFKNKNSFIKKKIRDEIWTISPWFNKEFKEWLTKEKPTHIFVAPGPNIFFYKIALKIINYLNIPVLTYICDDYYFTNLKSNFFERIYQKKLIKNAQILMNKSDKVITICDELSYKYENYFNVFCVKIMTGIEWNDNIEKCNNNVIKNISYMGNLSYKRYLNIYDLGLAIDNLNEKLNTNIKFNVYSNINNNDVRSLFDKTRSIEVKGFVTNDEYIKAKENTDLFVHTESFDKQCIERVKSSISTKIPECLNSGKVLLAYGPDNVASIKYLKNNKCAFVITKKDDLEEKLYEIITKKELREEIIDKALRIGRENHDSMKNSEELRNIIKGI